MRPPPSWLVALDPAKRRCGIALFRHGRLYCTCTIKTRKADALPGAVLGWVELQTGILPGKLKWVAETPAIYERDTASRPKLAGLFDLIRSIEHQGILVERITPPSRWKGNISKTATKHRVLKQLHNFERDRMLDREEDTFDAVGLGLWYLGRVTRGLVPPGG